jgi:hypothetical protein
VQVGYSKSLGAPLLPTKITSRLSHAVLGGPLRTA